MIPISATVITYNEDRNIRRCLESLSWVDEIVVVDSGSKDRTRAFAAEYTDRVLVHPWQGHIRQKTFAVTRAGNRWVLSLDADEEVSPDLAADIARIFHEGPRFDAYEFPRLSRYMGRWIRHGDWYPDRRVRLFDREKGHWGGADPHDRVIVAGTTGRLDAALRHYPYPDLDTHLRKMDFLTSVAAAERYRQGQRASVARLVLHPPAKFLRCFLLRLGILDGYPGFVIAWLGAFNTFLKYLKLRELYRRQEKPTGIDQIRPVSSAAGGPS